MQNSNRRSIFLSVSETVLNTALNPAENGMNNIGSPSGGAVTTMIGLRDRSTTDGFLTEARSSSELPHYDVYHGPLHPPADVASPFYLVCKRLIDVIGALTGLILLSPVFLILYIMVRLDSPGFAFHRRRVLAKQTYSGGAMQTFDAFKFRTMIERADEFLAKHPELMQEYQKEFKLVHDPRITKIGGPLRRSSLDELPQLWNVLMGQMTLVGPRMITPPELVNYGPYSARLLSVKPGLTGLWQVSGRTNLAYSERVRLDMYYIENRSLRLDIEILIRTVGCVLKRQGAV